jgi:sigma-B regulation protein RsbU (phosphoserine phosphatase)
VIRRWPGYDISAYNFPTEEVSGDYYDWVRIYDDQIGIVIADVAGKGVPAAILMAFLRASLRAATHIGYAPNVSMEKVNYLLWESIERNQFVTAFHGILDASNKTLSYSNGGHNPPLLLKANGETSFIDYGEQPLGMFPQTRYHQYHLLLEPGDVMVLYTDGVTEAQSPDGVEFGRESSGSGGEGSLRRNGASNDREFAVGGFRVDQPGWGQRRRDILCHQGP